ncbi:hypothetical protein [Conchiformibius steedae]|uniref:hypothetical protein n=1 Tax=Conchiformibius steedae TaxID=153493 RepID=UPI0026EADA55|nr:hypothetical protein [Conchiformibius steedae]
MSNKTAQPVLKRFVSVFSTEQNGRFNFEFREVTKDDIRTVAYKKGVSWEEGASAIGKFMHGGDVDLSQDLLSIQAA